MWWLLFYNTLYTSTAISFRYFLAAIFVYFYPYAYLLKLFDFDLTLYTWCTWNGSKKKAAFKYFASVDMIFLLFSTAFLWYLFRCQWRHCLLGFCVAFSHFSVLHPLTWCYSPVVYCWLRLLVYHTILLLLVFWCMLE